MTERYNPLFKNQSEQNKQSMTASEISEASETPISPLSGKPMRKVFCKDVPVFVDIDRRLVLPMKREGNI